MPKKNKVWLKVPNIKYQIKSLLEDMNSLTLLQSTSYIEFL